MGSPSVAGKSGTTMQPASAPRPARPRKSVQKIEVKANAT